MDSCSYDPESKQVFFNFGNVSVAIDVEDYMHFLYLVMAMKTVVEEDPEIALGTYVDDVTGIEMQEFIIKDENEEFS